MEISGGDFYMVFTIYRNPSFDPSTIGGDVGVETGNVGLETGNVGLETGNVGLETGNVGLETGNVGVKKDKYDAILRILQDNPHTTAKELATQLHTTTRSAERVLRQLKHSGKIKREGSDRFGYWVVLE